MAEDFYANGTSWLVVRTLINTLADICKVGETDDTITAGAVTSIPIVDSQYNSLRDNDYIYLVDPATGTAHLLHLADAIEVEDTAITIDEYTFTTDIPAGAKFYISGEFNAYLLNTARPVA